MLYGWRIPFLLTVCAAPISIIFRMHMPSEFIARRQEVLKELAIQSAATRLASASSLRGHRSLDDNVCSPMYTASLYAHLPSSIGNGSTASEPAGHLHLGVKTTVDEPVVRDVGSPGGYVVVAAHRHPISDMGCLDITSSRLQQQLRSSGSRDQHHQRADTMNRAAHSPFAKEALMPAAAAACSENWEEFRAQLPAPHIPLLLLLRRYWLIVLLQFLWEAHMEATFYTLFSWVPSYLTTSSKHHITHPMTLWILIVALVIALALTLVAGHLSDRGIKRMWLYIGVSGVGVVATLPVLLLGFESLIGVWILQPLMVAMCGFLAGLVTCIGPQLYPAEVRTSGELLGKETTTAVNAVGSLTR